MAPETPSNGAVLRDCAEMLPRGNEPGICVKHSHVGRIGAGRPREARHGRRNPPFRRCALAKMADYAHRAATRPDGLQSALRSYDPSSKFAAHADIGGVLG